jgi:hypothetical protein
VFNERPVQVAGRPLLLGDGGVDDGRGVGHGGARIEP